MLHQFRLHVTELHTLAQHLDVSDAPDRFQLLEPLLGTWLVQLEQPQDVAYVRLCASVWSS